MSAPKRYLTPLLIILGVVLVLTGAWVSSRGETQAIRESGPELRVPILSPASPEETPTASVSSSPSPAVAHIRPGVPERLVIERIGVNAPVDSGGVLSDGTQEVPDDMNRTSWYSGGSKPGQPGNAVIVGHTWSTGDGVFDKLARLTVLSRIRLLTSAGERTYRVRSVGSIPLAEFPDQAAAIYRTTGKSGLVLMTCGDWNGSSYDATTVVYAELIS